MALLPAVISAHAGEVQPQVIDGRKALQQQLFEALPPGGPGVDVLHKVLCHAQKQKRPCQTVAISMESGQRRQFVDGRQFGLVCDVAVPQSAVVRADVAQIVQAAQPRRKDPSVADAIVPGDLILVGLDQTVEKF